MFLEAGDNIYMLCPHTGPPLRLHMDEISISSISKTQSRSFMAKPWSCKSLIRIYDSIDSYAGFRESFYDIVSRMIIIYIYSCCLHVLPATFHIKSIRIDTSLQILINSIQTYQTLTLIISQQGKPYMPIIQWAQAVVTVDILILICSLYISGFISQIAPLPNRTIWQLDVQHIQRLVMSMLLL